MKNLIILLSTLISSINLCFSQWVQTDGPFGQTNVSILVPHDSLLIASANCGYFSKNNLDDRWNMISDKAIKCYTIIGDSLYIGTEDNGTKIINLNDPDAPPSDFSSISTIALSHTESDIYGGTEASGFFELNDNGTYTIHNDGLPTDTLYTPWGIYYTTCVTSIEVNGNYIFSGTDEGLFRSDFGLNSWQGINNGLFIGYVVFVKNYQDTLYTGIGNNLYSSVDEGDNWSLIHTAPSNITSLYKQENKFYLSTSGDGIQYSENHGSNWIEINAGLTYLSVNTVTSFDGTMVCGTNGDGIFLYQDNSWKNDPEGIVCSWIRSMTVADDQVFATDEDGVYRLEASGDWTDITPSVSYELFGSLNTMNDTVFLSVEYDDPYDSPFILYSANSGNSWQNLVNPVPSAGDDPYRIYCDNHTLYVFEDDFMYYTSNLGSSWTGLGLPSQFCNSFNDFLIYNSVPFATACCCGQALKLDNNQGWVLSNNGLPTNRSPEDLVWCEGALFVYMLGKGMYASIDGGNNWEYRSNGLETDWSLRDFEHYNRHLFVTTDKGVFLTSDYGKSWVACNNGLKNTNAGPLKLLNDTLYVGTYGNGVWKQAMDNIELSIPGIRDQLTGIKIIPNPASDYFRLNLDENLPGNVKVLDLTGRVVLSEKINSTDLVSLEEIPEGIYIVVFISDQVMFSGKLAVNK